MIKPFGWQAYLSWWETNKHTITMQDVQHKYGWSQRMRVSFWFIFEYKKLTQAYTGSFPWKYTKLVTVRSVYATTRVQENKNKVATSVELQHPSSHASRSNNPCPKMFQVLKSWNIYLERSENILCSEMSSFEKSESVPISEISKIFCFLKPQNIQNSSRSKNILISEMAKII